MKEQELLVRLERGDYEELKNKETEFVKIKDENHLLKTKIKKLQNSALERFVYRKFSTRQRSVLVCHRPRRPHVCTILKDSSVECISSGIVRKLYQRALFKIEQPMSFEPWLRSPLACFNFSMGIIVNIGTIG